MNLETIPGVGLRACRCNRQRRRWRKIIRRAPSRLSCRIPPVVRSTPSRGISAAAWPRRLGKPFLIENKTGSGTVVGTNAVAKATPDGYTLLMGSSTPLAINATLYKNLPYDTKADLKLLALIAASPLVMVVNPSVPIRSYADMIREVKAKPKSFNYASAGIGSPHHLFMELLMSMTGMEMTHVPYRGTPPALTDLISGQIPIMFCDLISGLELMKAGKIRPIFTGTRARLAGASRYTRDG